MPTDLPDGDFSPHPDPGTHQAAQLIWSELVATGHLAAENGWGTDDVIAFAEQLADVIRNPRCTATIDGVEPPMRCVHPLGHDTGTVHIASLAGVTPGHVAELHEMLPARDVKGGTFLTLAPGDHVTFTNTTPHPVDVQDLTDGGMELTPTAWSARTPQGILDEERPTLCWEPNPSKHLAAYRTRDRRCIGTRGHQGPHVDGAGQSWPNPYDKPASPATVFTPCIIHGDPEPCQTCAAIGEPRPFPKSGVPTMDLLRRRERPMSIDAYDDLHNAEDLIGRLTLALGMARATLVTLVDREADPDMLLAEVVRRVGEAEDDGKAYCRPSCDLVCVGAPDEFDYTCPTDCGCPGAHDYPHGEERE